MLLSVQDVLDRLGKLLPVRRRLPKQLVDFLLRLLHPLRLGVVQRLGVCLEFHMRLEILEHDEKLKQDISAKVRVAELELEQVLISQVLGEVFLLGYWGGALPWENDHY